MTQEEIMSQSPMTDEQIMQICKIIELKLKSRRSEFWSGDIQRMLREYHSTILISASVFSPLREGKTVVRTIKVDRTRSRIEALEAVNVNVAKVGYGLTYAMPQADEEEVEVAFFKIRQELITFESLQKECDLMGLKLVDPFTLAAFYEQDPSFIEDFQSVTMWKESDGTECFLAFEFDRLNQKTLVHLGESTDVIGFCYVAAVRK